MSTFDYIQDVLSNLFYSELLVGSGPFQPKVMRIEGETYRIEFESGVTLIVDTSEGVVDDPYLALTKGFEGAATTTQPYRVIWRDKAGLPQEKTVEASSPRFARLHVEAPADASVEQI